MSVVPHIIAARRTAVVPRGGAFAALRVEDMAAPVVAALLADARIGPTQVDEVICAEAVGAGGNPARRIALASGLPERVAGLTIDRQCAGGLAAISLAAALVASGQARVVVAGGVESASNRILRARNTPQGPAFFDQSPFTPWPERDPDMAKAADRLGVARADQEALAMESHARALGRDDWSEIVPLNGQNRDPFARRLTPALLSRARVLTGGITSATTAVASDAAAFVLVAAADLVPSARAFRILGQATIGVDPESPGRAPLTAIPAALAQAGITPAALEQAEIMEAFAAQALVARQALPGLEPARINPRGGGLARGHAIGASGAVLAVRLFHDLERGPGLAAIAAAGGIASAMVLARV